MSLPALLNQMTIEKDPPMLRERLMWIAWPAFLVAGLLEMMVFSVLDPSALSLFGQVVDWSREAIYTISFFIFWGLMMLSGALTTLLAVSPFEVNRRQLKSLRGSR